MAVPRTSWAVPLMGICALIVLAAAIGLADDASARTIKVPDNYNTIMKAVDMAISGDTVLVSSGFYEEEIRITKSITLKGTSASNTVLTIYGSGAVITVTSPGVTISNLKT